MGRVEGKVVIITGGARGIGAAAAALLAKEGAKVAITDVLDSDGFAAAEKIATAGGTAGYWTLDVSDEARVAEVFAEVRSAFGPVNVLVNNAGITGARKPTHEITDAEWDHVMDINVKGVFYCTKHAVPYMLEAGGGSIINIASVLGIVASPSAPPYIASKGAVRLMSKTDALVYAPDRIRVNSIDPGFIWTPLIETGLRAQGDVEEGRKRLEKLHPLGRLGEPDDVAYGILYLASDESKFVTGSDLVIDGGYTAQ